VHAGWRAYVVAGWRADKHNLGVPLMHTRTGTYWHVPYLYVVEELVDLRGAMLREKIQLELAQVPLLARVLHFGILVFW
jgi:hypothetical protein